MITLGLNAAFHDSAAVLVVDGVPVAAAEEERFTRIKHAKRPLPFTAWELPFHAVAWCLEQHGITLESVDHVAYSLDPAVFAEGREDLSIGEHITLPMRPGAAPDPRLAPWDNPWDPLFLSYVVNAPAQLRDGAPHHLQQRLYGGRREAMRWRFHHVAHHLCHQASAFLAAPFESCAVMTLDGRGERATSSYGVWRDGRYRPIGEVRMPHSLGLLYERVTSYLGFLHSSDEYKVMALAAMGVPRWADAIAERVVVHGDGRFEVGEMDFAALAGPARERGAPMEQRHLDLAASLQRVLEDKVMALARWLREASGERHLAMAGGVALNCLMNARLRDEGPFERIWVQPAAGDAGTALGAALWVDGRERLARAGGAGGGTAEATRAAAPDSQAVALAPRAWTMTHAYLGPAWPDEAVEKALDWAGLDYEAVPDDAALVERTARLLAGDCIIGWYQGRMEWGPRALGARSILASPISPEMQQRLNDLKDREDFRPVAPAVLHEAFADWFEPAAANGGDAPFMLFTFQAKAAQLARIPSACHLDGSARVQTVHASTNPRFHALISAFAARTGVPVLVNTSFNVRGQPIVCSPQDALEAFFGTPLDALVIGHCIVTKPRAKAVLEAGA